MSENVEKLKGISIPALPFGRLVTGKFTSLVAAQLAPGLSKSLQY